MKKTEGAALPQPIVIDLCRELYDRFVMGGFEPQDAWPMVTAMLQAESKCPNCGGPIIGTSHGEYCPKETCKWGWEVKMDGSPLKPPVADPVRRDTEPWCETCDTDACECVKTRQPVRRDRVPEPQPLRQALTACRDWFAKKSGWDEARQMEDMIQAALLATSEDGSEPLAQEDSNVSGVRQYGQDLRDAATTGTHGLAYSGGDQQHSPCDCHVCTQARYRTSFQFQLDSAAGARVPEPQPEKLLHRLFNESLEQQIERENSAPNPLVGEKVVTSEHEDEGMQPNRTQLHASRDEGSNDEGSLHKVRQGTENLRGDAIVGRTVDEPHRPLVCFVCGKQFSITYNFCPEHKDEFERLRAGARVPEDGPQLREALRLGLDVIAGLAGHLTPDQLTAYKIMREALAAAPVSTPLVEENKCFMCGRDEHDGMCMDQPDFCVCDYRPRRKCSVHPGAVSTPQPDPQPPQLKRLRDFIGMVTEWTAKFPLKGDGSVEDCAAATEIYCCCEGAEENLYELRQIMAARAGGSETSGAAPQAKISLTEAADIGRKTWEAKHGKCAMCASDDVPPVNGLHRGKYKCGNGPGAAQPVPPQEEK